MIQKFCTLNSEAADKIIRKYKKNIGLPAVHQFEEGLQEYTFYKYNTYQILMQETEHVFARAFNKGHYTAARKMLKKQRKEKMVLPAFLSGVFTGLSILLTILSIYLVSILDPVVAENLLLVFVAYRMLLCILLLLFVWGVNIYIWSRYRINYILLFEFPINMHIVPQVILRATCYLAFMFLLSFFLMLVAVHHPTGLGWMNAIHPAIFPFILFVLYLTIFISTRPWLLLKSFLRVVCAPFFSSSF